MFPTTRRPIALSVSLLILLAGCSSGTSHKPKQGAPTSTSASSAVVIATQPSTSEIDGLFDVGGGRKLHLVCSGSGSPTILLEAGGGADSSAWGQVAGSLETQTRTCAYDRAGTGSSDPAPNRRRMMVDVRADLNALLAAAHISDRLLLVGASFGGQVVLDWALHNAKRVAGLVILDTDWPTGDLSRSPDRALSPQQRAGIKAGDAWNAPDNREHIAYQETLPETEAAVHPLPGIPIKILTAGKNPECNPPTGPCARQLAAAIELQKQWLKLSPTATRRVVDSSHDMTQDVPDIVVATILAALKEA